MCCNTSFRDKSLEDVDPSRVWLVFAQLGERFGGITEKTQVAHNAKKKSLAQCLIIDVFGKDAEGHCTSQCTE